MKVYKLLKFDDHYNKNGNFYNNKEYFIKEDALAAKKKIVDDWMLYCNSSELNKKYAEEYGPMTIKIVSFELTEED